KLEGIKKMSFLSGIINIGKEIEHGFEEVGQKVSQAVTNVEHNVAQAFTSTPSKPTMDLGAMMMKQQLQAGSMASVAAAAPAQPKTSGGFFSGLGNFFSDIAGKFTSWAVNGLASLLPAPLVQAGFSVASKYFGGQGGNPIDADLASHL